MGFNVKSLLSSPLWFRPIKFSIRLSIFTIVLLLLIGVTTVIITINYLTVQSILITTTKDYLVQASDKAVEQLQRYLEPLNRTNIAATLVTGSTSSPKYHDLTKIFYSLINNNSDLAAMYWGDQHGNLDLINRNKSGFYVELTNAPKQGVKQQLDTKGRVLATKTLQQPSFDPRQRPWYQQAVKTKNNVWQVYRFKKVDTQQPQFGVTSSIPIYDIKGHLAGVLGIDMLLDNISHYINNIKITPNSFIFILNRQGNLLAAHNAQEQLFQGDALPHINNITVPWITESFRIYRQQLISPFIFKYNNSSYIASYKQISGVKTPYPWLVGIVTPVTDITAPLWHNIYINLIITFICLLAGIFCVAIFASSLSRPIKKLAQDSDLICQLRLENLTYLPSKIKEVSEMTAAFMRMKNALRSFQRYLPVTLVRNLVRSNKVAVVGGEAKELTLLFTDIKNFTTFAEQVAPEKVMQYLSEYFQSISKIIIDMHGTIDKYIGDGMVAFWGAPLDDEQHAFHACQATLKIQQALQQLNTKWHTEGIPQATTRFGLNTGRVIVGNVGSEERLCYTSLGDPVNLASRLEGLNKVYDTSIIISEFIYTKIKDEFQYRLLDKVAVKGKTHGVYIYELLGEVDQPSDINWHAYNLEWQKAFTNYEHGNWQEALTLFTRLAVDYPQDKLIKIFIERCTNFVEHPPTDWHGTWIMDEK